MLIYDRCAFRSQKHDPTCSNKSFRLYEESVSIKDSATSRTIPVSIIYCGGLTGVQPTRLKRTNKQQSLLNIAGPLGYPQ